MKKTIKLRTLPFLILLGTILSLICYFIVSLTGQTTVYEVPVGENTAYDLTYDQNILRLIDQQQEADRLRLTFRGVEKGSSYVEITTREAEPQNYFDRFYVHTFGIITRNSFLGDCRGDAVYPIAMLIFLLTALWLFIRRYRRSVRISLYRYANIELIGIIVFICFFIGVLTLIEIQHIFGRTNLNLYYFLETLVGTTALFSLLVLPVLLLVSVYVTVSNLILLMREGRSWRNLLGFFMGIALIFMTFAPTLSGFGFELAGADLYWESSPSITILALISDIFALFTAYLECVLIGTIITALKAARHIPAFDKDYILILGCQIQKDGSLTKLLQGRTDRAMEFARMQEEKTGKAPVFVPSGGKGDDEVMAEAQAIHNYLRAQGIPESRILVEDKSTTTQENIRFSNHLIKKRTPDAKIAFSTTNYHVYRAGYLADEAGVPMEGIGAKTKQYFWINAFIREFIATLHIERASHIRVIVLLILAYVPVEMLLYYCRLF